MKDVEWTRKLMNGRRTPYYDALARLRSYHEAGHAVVGHALGWKVLWVSLQQVHFEPVAVGDPIAAPSRKERARRVASLRRAMAVHAAGLVAGTIHQAEVQERGFSSPQESRAYSTWWEIRASSQVKCGSPNCDDPDRDAHRIARDAATICFAEACTRTATIEDADMLQDPVGVMQALFAGADERRHAEVLRAEERAEQIVKRHWAGVCEVASSLHGSKNGVLKRQQVLNLLGRHVRPAG